MKSFFSTLRFCNFKSPEKTKKVVNLFDWQIENIEKTNLSKKTIEKLKLQKRGVIKHALKTKYLFDNDVEYFFPVFPMSLLLKELGSPFNLINQGDSDPVKQIISAKNSIDPRFIYDVRGCSYDLSEPYFIFGFKNGIEWLIREEPSFAVERIFSKTPFRPLNVSEVISMFVHFLSSYNGRNKRLSILGSRYVKNNIIPEFLWNGRFLVLSCDFNNSQDKLKVYPSCLERRMFTN